MENTITLSVNIIVKNEADKIENAIRSIRSIADEIIVIDTGSDDKTATICTRLGCEVYFHSWTDDFSDPRNKALDYSSSDWILVLDADEVANFGYADLPLEIMKDNKYGGVNLVIRNHIDEKDDSIQSKHRYTRLFRRDKGIRFTGRIHEQIRESIESKYEIYESDLEIEHFGYKKIDSDKLERNAKLLEQDLKKEADDWKYYHLAETHFSSGEKGKAREIFEKVVNSSELTDLQLDRVKTRLGQIYLGSDEYKSAEDVLQFSSADKDTEGLRQYVLAAVYLSTGRVNEALKLYNSVEVENSDLIDKSQLSSAKDGAEKYKSLIGS